MIRYTYENIFLIGIIFLALLLAIINYSSSIKYFKNIKTIYFTNTTTISKSNYKENKIDINSASFEQLSKIPNITSNIANEIIFYRQKHKFKDLAELIYINGIGKKKLISIIDFLCISTNSIK